jgi:hypothetical protein
MLEIDDVQTIEGITVYGDDRDFAVFYAVPEMPRFRVDDNGVPSFRFLKYRHPIDREDGAKGGGFAFFDTEFTLTPEKRETVVAALQAQVDANPRARLARGRQVELGMITYTRGTAKLLLEESNGTLVEAVHGAGKPSLFGRNIAAFMVELSPEGATLFEQALQGAGGAVQVVYDLYFWAKLPPLTARAWFEAEKFYEYEQTVTIDWKLYGDDSYRESITEEFRDEETMGVECNFDFALPDPQEDAKLKEKIRARMQRSLDDAILRKAIPDIDQWPLDQRGVPKNIEELSRTMEVTKVASFEMHYRENTAIEWNMAPQGTLPNITSLTDAAGNAIKWADHFAEIDLDDPFFKQLTVTVGVNASFGDLPIHSVEVHLEYHVGDKHTVEEWSFTSADDLEVFRTYIENDTWEYTFWYEVNFEGTSQTYRSEPEVTNERVLTINVDDLGVLAVEIVAGDIDFDTVRSAQLTMRYEPAGGTPIEEQFVLDEDRTSHSFRRPLFEPRRTPYRFRIDYFLADGQRIIGDWETTSRSPLLVNDPFGRPTVVSVRGAGDFGTVIRQIHLDLTYTDTANHQVERTSVVLNAQQNWADWSVPTVASGSGTVTYSGHIMYGDGTVKPIEEQTAAGTIVVGDIATDRLMVTVTPALLDWTQVRLAQVSLRYADPAGEVSERVDLLFNAQQAGDQTWDVPLKDPTAHSYQWTATYHLADGTEHTVGPTTTEAGALVLKAPSVAPQPTGGQPTQPTEPTQPTGGQPTQPTEPTQPTGGQPTQPAEPTEPTGGQPTQPTEPTQPTGGQPTQPTEPTQPTGGQPGEPTPPNGPPPVEGGGSPPPPPL